MEKNGVEATELERSTAMGSSTSFQDLRKRSDDYDDDEDDDVGHDEVELQWAAIERLPTFKRIRTSLFDQKLLNAGKDEVLGKKVINVTRLGALERRVFIDHLITIIDKDNLKLLKKLKERMARVGLELPTTDVRFKNLNVEAECKVVHGKPHIPTLWNTITNIFSAITNVNRCMSQPNKIKILNDVSGIVKPSRMTLLLGLPGCGKTTFLQTLAGKHDPSLKVSGEISYNGYKLSEFVPQKTSAYINQYDLHISDMTVRETIDFSARCQGIGSRADILKELSRREKFLGIIPEPDLDTYMKAISVEGLKRTLQTDYILKILGLDICGDTIVGDAMSRGISGGEKKRLTIGEMMVGPTIAFFMDEISTGLDSSTTFQIVTCLQQLAHVIGATILISLLQPTPETVDLFDDIILMDEGKIVYNGPKSDVQEFFEYCGFKCPPRKGLADFLLEVLSQKDQAQYWFHRDQPHSYVSTDKFIAAFKEFLAGQRLNEELYAPFKITEDHKNALSFNIYSFEKWELFKACLTREWLLTKRNSFLYMFRSAQLVSLSLIVVTLFIRTQMKIDEFHARKYMACLFFGLLRILTSGVPELALTSSRLGIFYKQRDLYFYPAWAYSIPSAILRIPFSFLDTFIWTSLIYFGVGYSPEPERFFRQLFIQFLLHQVGTSIFRLIAVVIQTPPVAAIFCQFTVMATLLSSGFIVPLPSMPSWIKWCFWISPLSHTDIGISVNEFLSPRWQKEFMKEVLQLIELDEIKDALVGTCGVSGISTEQRKRLTIAVELVSNPSIIFMDEPTTGLDARAAVAVMRVVKNIVSTKRTVVCTIHQPSIDIFEAFNEIILMKRGGQIIYSGELGQNSCNLIEYFEGIPGVSKIKENYNPATWMLEVTNPSVEAELGVDFAHLYKESHLYQRNKKLVNELRVPTQGLEELHFTTHFSQNRWEQFKTCLWKQHLSYWRNPTYNLGRLILAMVSSLLYGALLWNKGQKVDKDQDLFNIMGSVYVFTISIGASNLLSILPIVTSQRTIMYRERFAGMYPSKAHSLAQVIIEIPYIFLEATLFLIISYPAVNLYESAYKVSWYFYDIFCTLLNYKYMGMAIASLSSTYQMASICGSFCITVVNLFSGFLIPQPMLPKWWVWFYWIIPTSWTLRGLITSQYGDINREIIAFGKRKTITAFLKSHYGFKHEDMLLTAILLLAYPIFFASIFTFFTAKLNFQRR
ncbi:pleiotropic drug resistance protein 3-like isoform X3 [Gossypium raimondii]|uniref:pleiotropic drug resistance protein 3-like isoform X3 n=1 Tax=Gossypium raimondii TaxID=29730 RepID=UPI00227C35A8|nr:pleiotropic drug resistance protein 3-like isoform X3 [Gossypium raimondii]